MFIEIDLRSPPSSPRLVEPDDFGSFKLIAAGFDSPEALAHSLGDLGSIDADGAHAWLTLNGVRSLAGPRGADRAWSEQFDGMIGYARSKGWLTPDGDAIRAHIEWTGSD